MHLTAFFHQVPAPRRAQGQSYPLPAPALRRAGRPPGGRAAGPRGGHPARAPQRARLHLADARTRRPGEALASGRGRAGAVRRGRQNRFTPRNHHPALPFLSPQSAHRRSGSARGGHAGYWGIENKLHRTRDGHFKQDTNRIRHHTAAFNVALLNTFVLNYLLAHVHQSVSYAQICFAQNFNQWYQEGRSCRLCPGRGRVQWRLQLRLASQPGWLDRTDLFNSH